MGDITLNDSVVRICTTVVRRGEGYGACKLPDGRIIHANSGWSIFIPDHVFRSISHHNSNKSSCGTSFGHHNAVTLWMVGGSGTVLRNESTGVCNGSSYGFFIGTACF